MSKIDRIIIENQQGFLLKNINPLVFESYVGRDSIRIKDAKRIRHLKIHKYIPLRYLLVLLKEHKLILKPVTGWEDPYENFFIKEYFVRNGELGRSSFVSIKDLAKGLYGMSWTFQNETDSLWRIYSPDKLSVRITTNVEYILEAVPSEDDKWDVWMGKVKYKSETDIDKWIDGCKRVSCAKQFVNKIGDSFFIKRDAFVAEKEFRVIVNYYDNDYPEPSFLCFNINPHIFIESYITDPRLTKYENEAVKSALENAGAEGDKIMQSSLYKFKPRKVEMLYDPFVDF